MLSHESVKTVDVVECQCSCNDQFCAQKCMGKDAAPFDWNAQYALESSNGFGVFKRVSGKLKNMLKNFRDSEYMDGHSN